MLVKMKKQFYDIDRKTPEHVTAMLKYYTKKGPSQLEETAIPVLKSNIPVPVNSPNAKTNRVQQSPIKKKQQGASPDSLKTGIPRLVINNKRQVSPKVEKSTSVELDKKQSPPSKIPRMSPSTIKQSSTNVKAESVKKQQTSSVEVRKSRSPSKIPRPNQSPKEVDKFVSIPALTGMNLRSVLVPKPLNQPTHAVTSRQKASAGNLKSTAKKRAYKKEVSRIKSPPFQNTEVNSSAAAVKKRPLGKPNKKTTTAIPRPAYFNPFRSTIPIRTVATNRSAPIRDPPKARLAVIPECEESTIVEVECKRLIAHESTTQQPSEQQVAESDVIIEEMEVAAEFEIEDVKVAQEVIVEDMEVAQEVIVEDVEVAQDVIVQDVDVAQEVIVEDVEVAREVIVEVVEVAAEDEIGKSQVAEVSKSKKRKSKKSHKKDKREEKKKNKKKKAQTKKYVITDLNAESHSIKICVSMKKTE